MENEKYEGEQGKRRDRRLKGRNKRDQSDKETENEKNEGEQGKRRNRKNERK